MLYGVRTQSIKKEGETLYSRKQWTVGWLRNDGMLLAENGSSSLVILVTIKRRRVKVFCSTFFLASIIHILVVVG